MSKSGQGLTFKYDYLGRRIEKIVTGTGAADTKYLWAGWTLVAELSSNGTTVNRGFVYGPDFSDGQGNAGGAGSLLAQVDGGVATYTVPDVLGNVAGYVSNAGTLTAAVEYSPYGRVISTSGTYSNYPIGYAGQYTDWETGLVCYGHRYYWAKHGRFINRDPIEEQGGYNLYAFCLNGPTFRWDVLGNIVVPIGFTNSASGRYSTVLINTSTGQASMEFNSAQGDTGSYYKFIDSFDNTPQRTPSVPVDSKAGSGKGDNKDDFMNFQVPAAAGKGSNSGALIDFNSLASGFGDSDSVSTPLAGSGVTTSNGGGFVPRDPFLFDYWTVGAASAVMGVLAPFTARQNVDDFIGWVGLKNTPGLQVAESVGFATSVLAYAFGGAKSERPMNSVSSTLPTRYVYLDANQYPYSGANLDASNKLGLDLFYNPLGAAQNRADALRGLPKMTGFDLDEAPPAVLRQPEDPVIITPTPPADNRGAGQSMGTQLQGTTPGQKVIVIVNKGGAGGG